jgi:exodeoxyribonuclease VII small subunit
MPDTIKDFESAIAELERIVKQLEDGDLPLDKSLALSQRRIELVTERGQLQDASHLLDPDDVER